MKGEMGLKGEKGEPGGGFYDPRYGGGAGGPPGAPGPQVRPPQQNHLPSSSKQSDFSSLTFTKNQCVIKEQFSIHHISVIFEIRSLHTPNKSDQHFLVLAHNDSIFFIDQMRK